MRNTNITLCFSACILSACGSGYSELPELGAANFISNDLVGVWQVRYENEVTNANCMETIYIADDYSWKRESRDRATSGIYTINREPESNTRGSVTFTALSGNELESCNRSLDIHVGENGIRYYNAKNDERIQIFLDDDLYSEPTGTLFTSPISLESSTENALIISEQEMVLPQPNFVTDESSHENEFTEYTFTPIQVNLDSQAPVAPQRPQYFPQISENNSSNLNEEEQVASEELIHQESSSENVIIQVVDAETVDNEFESSIAIENVEPVIELIEIAETQNVISEEIQSEYSIVLTCEGCKVSEVKLAWKVSTVDVETLELFHFGTNDRVRLVTLGASDSENEINVTNTTEFSHQGGACFDLITTYIDGSIDTSKQTCFELI